MRTWLVVVAVLVGCSGSRPSQEPASTTRPPEPSSEIAYATPPPDMPETAEAPPPVAPAAAPPPSPHAGGATAGLRYLSDCSLTHPVAQDPCAGTAASTRGLASCASLGVMRGDACGASAPGCYVERRCPDGREVVADYLVCAAKRPSRCLTRSSRRYKHDVQYLSTAELGELARQIQSLPLARFRYTEQVDGDPRLGFLTEDAPAAPFVSADGRTVDLYALLAASIAAIQTQEERIRTLEQQLTQCTGRH